MRKKTGIFVFYFMLLVVVLQRGFGQETMEEFRPSTILYFVDVSKEVTDQQITTALVSRILEEMTLQNFDILGEPLLASYPLADSPEESGQADAGPEADIRLDNFFNTISAENADIVLATFYQVQRSNLLLQFTLFDPATNTGVGGLFTRARTGLPLFNTLNKAALELRPTLVAYLENRYEYVQPEGRIERIHISGEQESVQVFFAGRDVGSIGSGELLVPYTPFNIGTSVRVEMRKPGYHRAMETVPLDDAEIELTVPHLYKAHRFGLEAYWTLGLAKGAGVAFRYYLDPDYSYLQAYHHRHLNEYFINAAYENWNYDFGLIFGQYMIFPPQSFLRFSIAFGMGSYITSIENDTIKDFSDLYINLVNPLLELNFEWFQLFIRADLKYALGIGNNLLGRNWIQPATGIPLISLGVSGTW